MKASRLGKSLLGRLRHLAAWRCKEPVVVFESDDWGLMRADASAALRNFGTPNEWANETLETPDDLQLLYRTLEQYRDPNGRPACFVGNFVVANPDFEAIARDRFAQYHETPISQIDAPGLKAQWVEGVQRRVLHPQYHARAHLWPARWLHDLRTDAPGARALFDARCPGGLSLLEGEGWRYHSEYIDWHSGHEASLEDQTAWLQRGLEYFQEVFNFRPRSTIAPHYIFTARTRQTWKAAGIHFVQGAGYRLVRGSAGQRRILSHILGERAGNAMIYLTRPVKFEPSRADTQPGFSQVIHRLKACFRANIPAIIDTHRINYTGVRRDRSLAQLAALLDALKAHRPYILTTVELGEAIAQQGSYRDVWTGEQRTLAPLHSPMRRALNAFFQRHHAHLEQKAD